MLGPSVPAAHGEERKQVARCHARHRFLRGVPAVGSLGTRPRQYLGVAPTPAENLPMSHLHRPPVLEFSVPDARPRFLGAQGACQAVEGDALHA